MEFIDQAYGRLEKLIGEIRKYDKTIFSEQDTRVKVIDRVFNEILDWKYENFTTETAKESLDAKNKGFLDYQFNDEGLARLVVEAKKKHRSLGIDKKNSGKAYKLNGPIFTNHDLREGIDQGIGYCAYNGVELCTVTNGEEWIIFRANRLGDGTFIKEGKAFVFSCLEDVLDNFKLFYSLLYRKNILDFSFRSLFREVEGKLISSPIFSKSLKQLDKKKLLQQSQFSSDLEVISKKYFDKLIGEDDLDFLINCFVTTPESNFADERLKVITNEILTNMKELDLGESKELASKVKNSVEGAFKEFALIIGTKGSGKSTFTERFFKVVLDEQIRSKCVVTKLDLSRSSGDEGTIIDWITRELLNEFERNLYKSRALSFNDITGMFFSDYQRWSSGTYKELYERDKTEFKIQFGKFVEDQREQNKYEYLKKMIRMSFKNWKLLPIFVFDNTDHFSIAFQERIFQFARGIFEDENCFVILPITDKTSWHLSRQGAIQSFSFDTYFLPKPSINQVVQTRLKYIDSKIKQDKEKGTYNIKKGMKLSFTQLNVFISNLYQLFLGRGESITKWVFYLGNLDVRRSLELIRGILVSPYIKIDQLLMAEISNGAFPVNRVDIQKAIIKQKYDIYSGSQNKFIHNIYHLTNDVYTSPLLPLRMLLYFNEVKKVAKKEGNPFVDVSNIYAYFQPMGYDEFVLAKMLDILLKTGLIFNYDPTISDVANVRSIEISNAGIQHLFWGKQGKVYLTSMMEVTQIHDQASYEGLKELYTTKYFDAAIEFIDYLVKEDSVFTKYPNSEEYSGQKYLISDSFPTLRRQFLRNTDSNIDSFNGSDGQS